MKKFLVIFYAWISGFCAAGSALSFYMAHYADGVVLAVLSVFTLWISANKFKTRG